MFCSLPRGACGATAMSRDLCSSNCGLGGFGSTWHHDAATSQLTFGNRVCENLAVYYLEPYQPGTSHHWLECALAEQPSLQSFVPVSTEDHCLLVLRNHCMLHRTPILSNLFAGQMRRFFYIPFRALDGNYQLVQLVPPKHATWSDTAITGFPVRLSGSCKSTIST